MANNTATNPVTIDTFAADLTVSASACSVKAITFSSAAAGDIAEFMDNNGVINVHLTQNINAGSVTLEFGGPKGFTFQNGLILDVSESTGLGAGDHILVYLA